MSNESSDHAAGWGAQRTIAGPVLQSGIHRAPIPDAFSGNVMGLITRAVVMKTYYPDEEDRSWVQGKQVNILCDVRTIGRQSRQLWKVPVMQRVQGLFDEDIYIPRDSSKNITGEAMVTQIASSNTGPQPTPAQNLDGDEVIVGFLENSPSMPVIFPFTMGHVGTRNPPSQSGGRVRRIRHGGALIEFSPEGNITIDATTAAKADLDSLGKEVSNSGTSGIITIRTKDGAGDISRLVLNESGVAILEDAGGGEFLILTKSSGQAELGAGTKAKISAPLVELSTAPLEPVIKGTTYTVAEGVLYGFLTAYMKEAAIAWAKVANDLPSAANQAGAAATAAGAWAAAITKWGTDLPLSLSTKVQTG